MIHEIQELELTQIMVEVFCNYDLETLYPRTVRPFQWQGGVFRIEVTSAGLLYSMIVQKTT